jgi:hypothetical protein
MFPEWIRRFIMSAAAAEKHQRHQSASDDKRKERAQAERDPTMFAHFDAGGLIPECDSPNACTKEYDHQRNQNSDSTLAHTFHSRTFHFVSLAVPGDLDGTGKRRESASMSDGVRAVSAPWAEKPDAIARESFRRVTEFVNSTL